MADFAVALTPLHFLYLIGVITILTTMILRKDTPLVCIVFLFFIGLVASGTLTGGIQTVFTSILYAAKEFMEIIATIALITALSKCLSELGSDRIMQLPPMIFEMRPSVFRLCPQRMLLWRMYSATISPRTNT